MNTETSFARKMSLHFSREWRAWAASILFPLVFITISSHSRLDTSSLLFMSRKVSSTFRLI